MTELPDRIDDSRRQQLNDDLTLAVGQGRIDLAEFSDLVDVIWSTTDAEQFARLERLIHGERDSTDLETLASKAAAPMPQLYDASSAPAPVSQTGTTHWFNEITRAGGYRLAERETHTLVASDINLDLRQATISAPVTTITVTSYLGTINLTVPPGIRVDNRMTGILSDVTEDRGRNIGPSSPTVVLQGRSYGGDITIRVREPGERSRSSWWSWLIG